MTKLDHIRVYSEDGHIVVRIDDYELFDYVDDCFTEEWSLEYSHMSKSQDGGTSVYSMHFAPSVSRDYVSRAVASLPPDEIERIWQLNNS